MSRQSEGRFSMDWPPERIITYTERDTLDLIIPLEENKKEVEQDR